METRIEKSRIFDITIAAVIGALLGTFLTLTILSLGLWNHGIRVTEIHATDLFVSGDSGTVRINGSTGISMNRKDYAGALLWFYEPGAKHPPRN